MRREPSLFIVRLAVLSGIIVAFLPFALTDLRNYADGCLTALKTFGPLAPPFNRIMLAPGAPLPNVPDIPRQAVDAVIASTNQQT